MDGEIRKSAIMRVDDYLSAHEWLLGSLHVIAILLPGWACYRLVFFLVFRLHVLSHGWLSAIACVLILVASFALVILLSDAAEGDIGAEALIHRCLMVIVSMLGLAALCGCAYFLISKVHGWPIIIAIVLIGFTFVWLLIYSEESGL